MSDDESGSDETALGFGKDQGPGRDGADRIFGRGQVPETIGPYRVIGELGRGGMGVVLKVLDTRNGAERALKFFEPRLFASEQAHGRFRREVRLANAMGGRGVVTVHDSGVAGGMPYYVMDLVRGGTLGDLIERRGPLPVRRVVAIGIEIARTLSVAHGMGILHRDLKPDNVLIDDEGKALLVDLGLAVSYDVTRYTQTGALMGTPLYMAPEQLRGRADARSDVYGLAATLYHALTGFPPVAGGSVGEVLDAVDSGRIVPAARLRPGIPAPLDRLLAKGLAHDPGRRPVDATSFALALEACLPEASTPTAAWSGRLRRFVVPAGALALAATAAALLFSSRAPGPSPRAEVETPHVTILEPAPGQKVGPLVVVRARLAGEPLEVRLGGRRMVRRDGVWEGRTFAFESAPIEVEARLSDRRRVSAAVEVEAPAATGMRAMHAFSGKTAQVVAISPDGRVLLAAGSGQVRRWRLPEPRAVVSEEKGEPTAALLDDRGRWAFTVDREGNLKVRRSDDLEVVAGIKLGPDDWRLALTRDGRTLLAAGASGVHEFRVGKGLLEPGRRKPPGNVRALVFSPSGDAVALGVGPQVTLVAWPSLQPVRRLRTGAEDLTALAWHPAGDLVACADESGAVHLVDPGQGAGPARTLHAGSGGGIRSLAFTPRGDHLVAACPDGFVRAWECGSGRLVVKTALPGGGRPDGLDVARRSGILACSGGIDGFPDAGEVVVYGWEPGWLAPSNRTAGRVTYRLPAARKGSFEIEGDATASRVPGGLIRVEARPGQGRFVPFRLRFRTPGRTYRAEGELLSARWKLSFFRYPGNRVAGRQPLDWARAVGDRLGRPDARIVQDQLENRWDAEPTSGIGPDHFAVLATTTIVFPRGTYLFEAISDDGIRVYAGTDLVLENWAVRARAVDRVVRPSPGGCPCVSSTSRPRSSPS